jgi:hypothetical protein
MFRDEKAEKVPLHLMPGYVSNLHQSVLARQRAT